MKMLDRLIKKHYTRRFGSFSLILFESKYIRKQFSVFKKFKKTFRSITETLKQWHSLKTIPLTPWTYSCCKHFKYLARLTSILPSLANVDSSTASISSKIREIMSGIGPFILKVSRKKSIWNSFWIAIKWCRSWSGIFYSCGSGSRSVQICVGYQCCGAG